MIKTRQYKHKKHNRTNSYWFLLPILKLKKNKLIKADIINCYLENHLLEYNYENSLLLLFNYDEKNQNLYNSLKEHEYFIEEYDTSGIGNLMFVFKLPEKYDEIIDIFKRGKYSEFPNWYKNGYFNKYTTNHTLTDEFKIFIKHEDKRKEISESIGMNLSENEEVRSRPIPEQEIYMYNTNFVCDIQE